MTKIKSCLILNFGRCNNNIIISCSATGMHDQMLRLIKKYNKQGVNVYENDIIKEILEDEEIFENDIN